MQLVQTTVSISSYVKNDQNNLSTKTSGETKEVNPDPFVTASLAYIDNTLVTVTLSYDAVST